MDILADDLVSALMKLPNQPPPLNQFASISAEVLANCDGLGAVSAEHLYEIANEWAVSVANYSQMTIDVPKLVDRLSDLVSQVSHDVVGV